MNAISRELAIHILQAPDQVENVAPEEWSTSSRTKMAPAAEWTCLVDEAASPYVEHGASSFVTFRQCGPACGPKSVSCDERLSSCEHWHAPGETKAATFRTSLTGPIDRPGREIGVYGTHFCHRDTAIVASRAG